MDLAAAMPPGPVGLALESRGICSGQASGPKIFLGWARPGSYKLQARKLSSLTGPKL